MWRTQTLIYILFVSITLASLARADWVKSMVAYREVDGHEVFADVYRPSDEEVRPVIVWIHGGALIMGHRGWIHRPTLSLAKENGYAFVSIDYRLAPETKLPQLIGDIQAAFAWLADDGARQFHLDTERIVVSGGSAGGYLALVTGYSVQPRPKAVVALYGYGELVGDWYSKPSPHPRHNARMVSRAEAERQSDGAIISDARLRKGDGGTIYLHYRQTGTWPQEVSGFPPAKIKQQIAPFEPVRNVTGRFPPTLLIHGSSDTDVPYEQSVLMAACFKQHDVPHRLVTLSNAEHGFDGADPQELANAYSTMNAFIVHHLADE